MTPTELEKHQAVEVAKLRLRIAGKGQRQTAYKKLVAAKCAELQDELRRYG
jgi:hypothetical protein